MKKRETSVPLTLRQASYISRKSLPVYPYNIFGCIFLINESGYCGEAPNENNDDSDLFINSDGQIGSIFKYHGQVLYGQCNPLIFTNDRGTQVLNRYLNGKYIGNIPTTYASRWTVGNAPPRVENGRNSMPLLKNKFEWSDSCFTGGRAGS